jgi:hypothetical protein
MTGFKRTAFVVPALLLALATFFLGCSDEGTNDVAMSGNASGVVSGRIIDASTRQPVANAEVTIIYDQINKITAISSDSTDPELAGTFVINGLPGGSHTLLIKAAGYATINRPRFVYCSSYGFGPVSVALGDVALYKGTDVTVVVTADGVPQAGITVYAARNYDMASDLISGVTTTDGTVALSGLSCVESYAVCNTITYDGASVKYPQACTWYNPVNNVKTVSLALRGAQQYDSIRVVADNLIHVNGQSLARPGQSIVVVYNYPVTLAPSVTVSYFNTLVPNSDPDFGFPKAVATTTASLDATNTILTIANSSAWTINQSYRIDKEVTAIFNGQTQFDDTEIRFSVIDDTPTGLSDNTTLVADNYNNTWDGGIAPHAPTTTPSQIYVNFPEFVYGTYKVTSTTNFGVTQDMLLSVTDFLQPGSVVFASNGGGKDAKTVYRMPLNLWMADLNSSLTGTTGVNRFTVFFDVRDAEGNAFTKEVTLDVQ